MRCAGKSVSDTPDTDAQRRTKNIVSLLALVAIAVLSVWAIVDYRRIAPTTPVPEPMPSATPAFAGAAPERLFLTQGEVDEGVKRGLLPAGARSIIRTGKQLSYGEWHWDDKGVPAGPTHVRVDLARQLVSVYRGPDEIGTAVMLYGVDGKDTPRGKLPILGKTRDYHSKTYDAPMPYSLWLRDDGVALHGSSVTAGRATNGCIGVPEAFAAKLFEIAEKGDIIEVVA